MFEGFIFPESPNAGHLSLWQEEQTAIIEIAKNAMINFFILEIFTNIVIVIITYKSMYLLLQLIFLYWWFHITSN